MAEVSVSTCVYALTLCGVLVPMSQTTLFQDFCSPYLRVYTICANTKADDINFLTTTLLSRSKRYLQAHSTEVAAGGHSLHPT